MRPSQRSRSACDDQSNYGQLGSSPGGDICRAGIARQIRRGIWRRRAAAPPAALHPAGLPIRGRATAGAHAFGTPLLRRQRFGSGWSGAWVGGGDYYPYGGSSYPYYDTSGYGTPYEPPPSPYPSPGYYGTANSAPVAPRPVYLVPYHPGCDSQTQTLPWRTGDDRSITIVRC